MAVAARPSELELQVLAVLWREGALTAREVNENMPDGKARAYTTVLSILQVMEKKGLVTHRAEGRTHRYAAKATKRQVLGPMLRQLVSNVFGGSATTVVQHLLAENQVSAEELREIQDLVAQHESTSKTTGRKKS